MSKAQGNGRRRATALIAGIVALLAVGLAAMGWSGFRGRQAGPSTSPTAIVQRGPLTISIIESGTIKNRQQEIIKSEVEGTATIQYLIPEGTRVKKGDLLVTLDASRLNDQRVDQQIKVMNVHASFVRAKEQLEVVKNQAEADVAKAELDHRFAKEDLKKYVEGEYPQSLKDAESKIKVAEEEVQRSREKLRWSKVLFDEKYLSQSELQADDLAAKKAALDLDLRKGESDLLQKYTRARKVAELESNVTQTALALERAKRKASADVVQAQADLAARESEHQREQGKLEKADAQIAKTKIKAPTDGMVVYASSAGGGMFRGNAEPLAEGQSVRERQDLILLPTAAAVLSEVKIHESALEKVRLDLPAVITVDAVPGKTFTGRVRKIAPLPDATSVWLNPDLKVYTTEIWVDGDGSDLRTGMTCRAEIVVEQFADTLYVPIQAVTRVGGISQVQVMEGASARLAPVEIGRDNNRMVRIVSGLAEGQVVSLAPPLATEATTTATERLVAAAKVAPAPPPVVASQPAPAGPAATMPSQLGGLSGATPPATQPAGTGDRTRGGWGNLSDEQRAEMRKRLESMSPEERERLRQQFGGRRGGGGGGGGTGGPGGGGPPGQPPGGAP